jgi:hypothetical protein
LSVPKSAKRITSLDKAIGIHPGCTSKVQPSTLKITPTDIAVIAYRGNDFVSQADMPYSDLFVAFYSGFYDETRL